MLNGAMIAFDPEGGAVSIILRGLTIIALFSSFGVCVVDGFVVVGDHPDQLQSRLENLLKRVLLGSLIASVGALTAWLVGETVNLVDEPGWRSILAGLPKVALSTRFGHVVLLQAGCALAALILMRWFESRVARRLIGMLTGAALALHAGHSHGLAMYDGPSLLLLSDVLHLLAGGAWLGSLLPLLLVIYAAPDAAAARFSQRFATVGTIGVCCLIVTAAYQGWQLIGSVPGLVGTAYGLAALAKVGLLSVLLGFAAVNRWYWTPALLASADAAKRRLVISIGLEAGVGLILVTVAATLASLPPALHLQPVWPFSSRLSLEIINEDPDFRAEIIGAIVAVAGAILLFAAALSWRRIRWVGFAATAALLYFAIPHFSLLLVDAQPTSFYRSPTGFAASGIVTGAESFQSHCADCHGAQGRGDGPRAKQLPVPPVDLTAGHLWAHSDGEMFGWLTDGIRDPEGAVAMPGFGDRLSEDERWTLIDYVRAHNAGIAYAAQHHWPVPLHTPDAAMMCSGDRTMQLSEFSGQIIRLVFGDGRPIPIWPAQSTIKLATVLVAQDADKPGQAHVGGQEQANCRITDPAFTAAYAIVTGLPKKSLGGSEILIDGNGYIRLMQEAGSTMMPSLDDPQHLLDAVQTICRHPLASSGGSHAHHH